MRGDDLRAEARRLYDAHRAGLDLPPLRPAPSTDGPPSEAQRRALAYAVRGSGRLPADVAALVDAVAADPDAAGRWVVSAVIGVSRGLSDRAKAGAAGPARALPPVRAVAREDRRRAPPGDDGRRLAAVRAVLAAGEAELEIVARVLGLEEAPR